MARKIALVLALMVLPLALQVQALGLGNIKVRSGLNQPLVAEIALLSPRGVAPEEIRVGLAQAEDFTRAGIERPIALTALDFKLERKSDGTLYIRVTSRQSIREPFLNFLVELSWPSGRLLREYTVLLDPPTFSGARAPAPRAAGAAGTPAHRGDTYRVSQGDTLWSIAQRTRPGASISPQQMMVALQRSNPNAFINGNMNNLMAGQVLRIPDRQAIGALSDAEARREVQRQYEEWRQARTAPPAPAPEPEEQAGGEQPAAVETAPEAEAAPAAPAEAQPEETLPATGQALPEQPAPETAESEAAEPAPAAPEAGDAAAPSATPGQPQPVTGEGELKLLAPEDTAAAGQAGEAPVAEPGQSVTPTPEEALDSVRQELALTTESVDTLQRENAQLQERFAELESQVDSLQKLIDLKDAELAGLERDLEQQQAAAAETGEEPTDLLGRLLRDPVNLSVLAVAVLLLLLIVWMMTRRRGADQPVEPAAARAPAGSPEAAAAAAATSAALAGAAGAEEVELSGPEEAGLPPRPAGSDPVAEADVYIAYGRFSQAEELLRSLLETRPNAADARLKLLEVYYATRDRDAFEAEAAELFEQVTEADPMWLKAAEMGRELCPGVPMFALRQPSGSASPAEAGLSPAGEGPEEADLALEEEAGGTWHEKIAPAGEEGEAPFAVQGLDVEPEPSQQRADETGVNFDLDFLREDATGAEPGESRAAEQMPAIDFDIDELEREARQSVSTGLDEDLPGLDEELSGLELDLGFESGREAVEEAFEPHPAIETEPEEPTLAASADLSSGELRFEEEGAAEEGELDLLPDVDEVSTKLDLARAYIDMGDEEGAREILGEVLDEGNESQQQEARGLLDQLTQ